MISRKVNFKDLLTPYKNKAKPDIEENKCLEKMSMTRDTSQRYNKTNQPQNIE